MPLAQFPLDWMQNIAAGFSWFIANIAPKLIVMGLVLAIIIFVLGLVLFFPGVARQTGKTFIEYGFVLSVIFGMTFLCIIYVMSLPALFTIFE